MRTSLLAWLIFLSVAVTVAYFLTMFLPYGVARLTGTVVGFVVARWYYDNN